MHADYLRYRPAGYHPPPGPRGLKFRLVEKGWYDAYLLLAPVNRARLAATRLIASRRARPA